MPATLLAVALHSLDTTKGEQRFFAGNPAFVSVSRVSAASEERRGAPSSAGFSAKLVWTPVRGGKSGGGRSPERTRLRPISLISRERTENFLDFGLGLRPSRPERHVSCNKLASISLLGKTGKTFRGTGTGTSGTGKTDDHRRHGSVPVSGTLPWSGIVNACPESACRLRFSLVTDEPPRLTSFQQSSDSFCCFRPDASVRAPGRSLRRPALRCDCP